MKRFSIPCVPHYILKKGTAVSELGSTRAIVRPQFPLKREEREVFSAQELERVTNTFFTSADILLVIPYISVVQEYYIRIEADIEKGFVIKACESTNHIEQAKKGRVICEKIGAERRVHPFQVRRMMHRLSISRKQMSRFFSFLEKCVAIFFRYDAQFLEISSMVLTEDGFFQVQGVQMLIDDCSLFRQPELQQLKGDEGALPIYVGSGAVTCIANGEGLALSTGELLGGAVGSVFSSGEIGISNNSFSVLDDLFKKDERAFFLHFFTGLVDCLDVAKALVQHLLKISVKRQCVVRLEGTNAFGGCRYIQSRCPSIHVTTSLREAAQCVLRVTKEGEETNADLG